MNVSRLPLALSLLVALTSGCSETDLGEPPDCEFMASTFEGTAPLAVVFSVTVADDTDYTVKQYVWDFNGDGTVDETTDSAELQLTASYTYSTAGEYTPAVKVVFNEADAWTRVPLNGSFSQRIVVTAAP